MIKELATFKNYYQMSTLICNLVKQSKGCIKREHIHLILDCPTIWGSRYEALTTKNKDTFSKYLNASDEVRKLEHVLLWSDDNVSDSGFDTSQFQIVLCSVNKIPTVVVFIPKEYDIQLELEDELQSQDINFVQSSTVFNYIREKLGVGISSKVGSVKEFSNPIQFDEACRLVNASNRVSKNQDPSTISEEIVEILEVLPGCIIRKATDFKAGGVVFNSSPDSETTSDVPCVFDLRKCYVFIKSRKTELVKPNGLQVASDVFVYYYKPNPFNYGLDRITANVMSNYILTV